MDKDKFAGLMSDGWLLDWSPRPAIRPNIVTDRNVQYVVRRGALFVDPEWARIMGREDLQESPQ